MVEKFKIGLIIIVVAISNTANAKKYMVKSDVEYRDAYKKAQSSDTICWEKGTYSDISLEIKKDNLVIMAEQDGQVTFAGNSYAKIFASGCEFRGFQFIGGRIDGSVVRVDGSHNKISQLNISAFQSKYYLDITPTSQYTEVTYCNFERKPEKPESSVVEVQVAEGQPGYHVIRYCSFKNHTAPAGTGSDYGIEALRIGYSFQSKFISRTIVEYCYFTKCNGDGEIISSKARENIFRYNTFLDNGDSHFTIRHGKDNVVYGNFFLGGAGLRIKEGQNQMVYNNYFETGKRFAIQLVNYNVDPLQNIVIDHNTFVSSGAILLGGQGDFPPTQVVFANNLIVDPTGNPLSDPVGTERFIHNAIDASETAILSGDFVRIKANLERNDLGFMQPGRKSKALHSTVNIPQQILDIPVLDDDPEIGLDIMQQKRPANLTTRSLGCAEYSGKIKVKPYVINENTGPGYLH